MQYILNGQLKTIFWDYIHWSWCVSKHVDFICINSFLTGQKKSMYCCGSI